MEYRIGVDLGGTAIKAGVIDGQDRIVCRVSVPTGASRPFETVVADMAGAAAAAAAQAGLRMTDFPCVGFGMPGLVDHRRGINAFAGNLGWKQKAVAAELQKHVDVPVCIGNDANCAVIGETIAGAARGYDNVLMLTLGTGVAAASSWTAACLPGATAWAWSLATYSCCLAASPARAVRWAASRPMRP